MGLFDALTSAVSGLQAQAFAMQNISGNIANSQTVAYKGNNTSFLDLIPGDEAPTQQVAVGVTASSVATNSAQGAIQTSTTKTNMAVNGDGFLLVKSPNSFSGNVPIFDGVDNYTRRGDFQQNSQGYLVNGAGYYLEGIALDPKTGNPVGSVAAPLQFQNNFLAGSATTQVTIGVNLPTIPVTASYSAATPNSELLNPSGFSVDPTVAGVGTVVGSDVSTFMNESVSGGSVTVYDAAGTPAGLQLRWAKTDSVANGGSDTWNLFYQTNSNASGAQVAWQNVGTNFVFGANGQLNPPIASLALNGVSINGVSVGNISLNSPTGSVTQFASSNGVATVNNMTQNGYAAGQLQSIAVNNTGTIVGTFSNGQNINLADVPLVHFNNPDGLQSLDGGAYQQTSESGAALAGASGQIVGASLEGSNTDIATEFTKLIVNQQAYSANTKVITTANQMSQDLLNILR